MYSNLIYTLIVDALRREESELAKLNEGSRNESLKSVRQFQEHWIQYLIIKEAARKAFPLHFVCERHRIDIAGFREKVTYLGRTWGSSEPAILIELKQPLPVNRSDPHAVQVRRADIDKLSELQIHSAERYVVWFLAGTNRNGVDQWIQETVVAGKVSGESPLPTVVRGFSEIVLNENCDGDKIMVPCMWMVRSGVQAAIAMSH